MHYNNWILHRAGSSGWIRTVMYSRV